jgi:ketosteroid isomerase-like protein
MKPKLLYLLICAVVFSCKPTGKSTESKLTVISEINATPTVDIDKYSLVLAADEDRKKDAEEILSLKRKWPLVMQSPRFKGLDTLLSKDFTFVDNGRLFNKAAYIEDRLKLSDWKITHVKYENLSLQFFGELALLTYRNRVTNEQLKTKEIEVERINWADIYVKENDKWKIKSAHVVDVKIEPEKL